MHSCLTELCKWVDRILSAAMLWTLSTLIVCFILGSRQLLSLAVFIRSNERRRYVEKTRAQTTDYSRLIRKNNAFICIVSANELFRPKTWKLNFQSFNVTTNDWRHWSDEQDVSLWEPLSSPFVLFSYRATQAFCNFNTVYTTLSVCLVASGARKNC